MPAESTPYQAAPIGGGFAIRRFQTGDGSAVNDLFNRVFGLARPMEEWHWKFEGSRAASGSDHLVINVAEAGGTVVGQFASLVIRFMIRGDVIPLALAVDTAIDPGHRGGGRLVVQLSKAHGRLLEESGLLFGFGTPNPRHYAVGKAFLGYHDLFTLQTWRARLNVRHSLHRRMPWLPGLLVRAAGAVFAMAARMRTGPQYPADTEIAEIRRFDARADDLWGRLGHRDAILAIRDARYLNWRYIERPGRPYIVFAATRYDRLAGFVVVKLERQGDDLVGLIMDLFAESEVEPMLVHYALAWLRDRGADYASCQLIAEGRLATVFGAAGFRESPGEPRAHLIIAPHQEAERRYPGIAKPEHWHLGLGDFDGA